MIMTVLDVPIRDHDLCVPIQPPNLPDHDAFSSDESDEEYWEDFGLER